MGKIDQPKQHCQNVYLCFNYVNFSTIMVLSSFMFHLHHHAYQLPDKNYPPPAQFMIYSSSNYYHYDNQLCVYVWNQPFECHFPLNTWIFHSYPPVNTYIDDIDVCSTHLCLNLPQGKLMQVTKSTTTHAGCICEWLMDFIHVQPWICQGMFSNFHGFP